MMLEKQMVLIGCLLLGSSTCVVPNHLHRVIRDDSSEIAEQHVLSCDDSAHFNEADENGHTPLQLAASLGKDRICSVLIRQGADFSVVDAEGCTLLHLAAASGCLATIKVIKVYVELGVLNREGKTARAIAQEAFGCEHDVTAYLIDQESMQDALFAETLSGLVLENRAVDHTPARGQGVQKARSRIVTSAGTKKVNALTEGEIAMLLAEYS